MKSNFIFITTLRVSGSLSAHRHEFLAVHRHWYFYADLMTVCYQELLLLVANGHQICIK